MNLRQAAQQALEALEHWDTKEYYEQESIIRWEAMNALREALAEPNKCTHGVSDSCKECYMAEPEQEPVAWYDKHGMVTHDPFEGITPLYTAPPQRKPLTDEEIEQAYRHIYRSVPDDFDHTIIGWIEQGIRYAEQAHGIKGEV